MGKLLPHLLRGVSLLIFAVAVLSSVQSVQGQAATVTVTVNSITNKGCFDQFVFCNTPDMMVGVAIKNLDGTLTNCANSTPSFNLGVVTGPIAMCSGIVSETPFSLVFSLFDVDENSRPPGKPVVIQQKMRLSNDASKEAEIPWFRLQNPTITINGPDADLTFTPSVAFVNPVFKNPALALSATSFDPQLGERVIVSNMVVLSTATSTPYPGTRVRLAVTPAGAQPSTFLAEGVIRGVFNLDWDGKLNGQPVSPGNYTLTATLVGTGASQSASVNVVGAPKVFEVSSPPLPRPWNPRAGAIAFSYKLNPGGTVTTRIEGPAPAGNACLAGTLPIATPNFPVTMQAGVGNMFVTLKNASGIFLPTGNYCVHFDAKTSAGLAIGSAALDLSLENAPPIRLIVSLSPAVPAIFPSAPLSPGSTVLVPATPLFVEARVFDDLRKERATGSITVRAMPDLIIPINSTDISSATCLATSVCRLQVSAATLLKGGGSATGAGSIIFDAFATDLPNQGNVDPQPATSSTSPRATWITVPSPNMTIAANVPVTGSIAKGFNTPAHNSMIDVAFHAGTGFDLSVPAQATNFSDIIGRTFFLFFGGNTSVGDTSVAADADRIAFWISQKPATVVFDPGSDPPGLCNRTQVQSVPFAEVQAVIHTVNCRDNADWNGATFSAELGGGFPVENIVWHEFHHAAYDLADEYPPDGGYFQTDVLPNVMKDPNECTLRGAEPALCAQIGTTGWWRAAPMPDVMIDNTRENLDEKRLATFKFNRCKGALC